jgi:cation transport regulator
VLLAVDSFWGLKAESLAKARKTGENRMHYETVKQLPVTIRDVLPDEAMEIYRKAYNQAWERFDQDANRGLNQQGLAHQQAWGAVKQEYVFDLDEWHRKGETVERKVPEGILDKIKGLFSRYRK